MKVKTQISPNPFHKTMLPISDDHETSHHNNTYYEISTVEGINLYRGQKIAVVIPAYNEEVHIGKTLSSIPEFITRIYPVDDCSTDNTWKIILEHAKIDSRIIPLRHENNRGPGAAIVTGYRKALDDHMDFVVTMDGDNQMDPAFLPSFLDPLIDGKCDFSKGNRLYNYEYRKEMSNWRFFGNSILTLLTRIASGYWSLMDPQSGYTAITKKALVKIDIDSLYPGYGYVNDRLVKLNVHGFRIANIPHPARYQNEKSGIRYRSYLINVPILLLGDFIWRIKVKYFLQNFHSISLLYIIGAFFCFSGVICGIYSFYGKFLMGKSMITPEIGSLLLLGIGVLSLSYAMFRDMKEEQEIEENKQAKIRI
jgi:glycosyltransferase involved in cell wall biosynthesis